MRIPVIAAALFALCLSLSPAQEPTSPGTVLRVVNEVEITGNTLIPTDELMEHVGIKSGDLLTVPRLERGVAAIQELYRERGYLAVVTDDIVGRLQETGTLTLPVVEVRIAEIKIEGLQKTREDVVRRMLEVGPGDFYYVPALRRDADRLFALRIFESVDANIELTEDPGRIIVVWLLKEREKSGYFTLSGSYSPSDLLVGSVTIVETNLGGRAKQIGGTLSIGSISGRLSAEAFYTDPWIRPQTSMTVRGFSNVRYRFSDDLVPDTDRYFERRTGGQILATRTLSAVNRFTLGTRFENVSVDNLPLDQMTTDLTNADGRVAAVSGEYITDRRDSLFYPATGTYHRLVLEPGHVDPDQGSTNWILKGTNEYQRYFPLDRITVARAEGVQPDRRPRVIAARLVTASSVGTLPFFEQYFLGGTRGLRGYREDRFWGDHMLLATVEYRQPLGKSLTAVGFVDVGDAWGSQFQFQPGVETQFDQHRSFSPRVGGGIGLRYVSPAGPIGLDFAWGEEFRTHFVLGQTF